MNMDLLNTLISQGIGSGDNAVLQLFLFLLGVFAAFLFTYLVFYILAFVLIWPRLTAKALSGVANKDVSRIRRLKTLFMSMQMVLLSATPLISWYLWPDFMKTVILIAVSYSLLFFILWILIRIAYHIPIINGFIYQNKPPDFFIREIGTFWLSIFCHPVLTLLLFIIISSHAVGIVLLLLGIAANITLRKYKPRSEDRDRVTLYRELKDSAPYGSKKYLLAELYLGDL